MTVLKYSDRYWQNIDLDPMRNKKMYTQILKFPTIPFVITMTNASNKNNLIRNI